MAKAESAARNNVESLNVDFMRSLVKQYSELGQWTSAFFWADAAAAAASSGPAAAASGDDIWLLASAMLARGELHRAAHAVTSRQLHRRHLLCLGVAMRAYLAAKEPSTALTMLEECDPALLEPRSMDQTHNRALAGVLVWQARALATLERREAAADALTAALRADCACYEALDLLLEQHALTPSQESELIESLPINNQMSASEAALLRVAYRDRLLRYAPLHSDQSPSSDGDSNSMGPVESCRALCAEAGEALGRRLAAGGQWALALRALDRAGPACCPDVRAACLVELRKSAELFAFAHALVDAYPQSWTAWYAVGCYYYLIGKSEFARRYLSKACGLEPGAGCVWLAYGHSFAADNEHDQAMAAYFKSGSAGDDADIENKGGWERIARSVKSAHVAHEAGAAAYAHQQYEAAKELWLKALRAAGPPDQLAPCWAATLDALGHASRALGQPAEALRWHERALALRPARAGSLAARGLCLALLGRESEAADALHAALARDPDHVVALALLDAIVDRLDAALTEEEIPQFPFPAVEISTPAPRASPPPDTSDMSMSMSFD
ncbi:cell division cycle protein 16 homolog isoform X2 [Maniola jurtina]|uniref:cell division cycle protein 16 homolog isoform X2 n=1 Tax=Maniola jurtina TaxID=191418 RepID=UPI001E68C454|nr:cell division cycle protein 16 homolog isoform X2 [Maniola jurtina]